MADHIVDANKKVAPRCGDCRWWDKVLCRVFGHRWEVWRTPVVPSLQKRPFRPGYGYIGLECWHHWRCTRCNRQIDDRRWAYHPQAGAFTYVQDHPRYRGEFTPKDPAHNQR